jgi:hypothetical protein
MIIRMNELAQAMIGGGIGVVLGYLYAPSRREWRRAVAYARRRADR